MIEKGIIDPAKVVRIALQDSRALRPASPNVTTKSSRFERVAQNRGPFLGHSSDAREDASLQTTELLVEVCSSQSNRPRSRLPGWAIESAGPTTPGRHSRTVRSRRGAARGDCCPVASAAGAPTSSRYMPPRDPASSSLTAIVAAACSLPTPRRRGTVGASEASYNYRWRPGSFFRATAPVLVR